MNTYQAQGLSGEFEFESDTQEFEDTEFGEAEYGEAEFEDTEYEDKWAAEVGDHRRQSGPRAAPRVRDHRRPAPYRSSGVSPRWSPRSRSYSPRSSWWGGAQSRYGYRPSGAQQQYRWGQPALTSRFYRGGQYPGRYWRYGQGQQFSGPQSGHWGRWRRRYPYGQYGYGGQYAQPAYYDEPPYEEPPMPPPVIVAPPPPPVAMPPAEPPMGEPMPAPPPPMQNPAKAEEFFIEPEAFEFEDEFGEYESGWGEMEGAYGESEGANGPQLLGTYEPKLLTGPCPTYLPGEEARSKTDAGHLPTDVFVGPDRLLIADFGVDWRHVKPGAARDPKLKAWLTTMIARMRSDPTVGLSIFGFSDCVGPLSQNMFLRRGRAERTRQLLLMLAAPGDRAFLDSRISFADAADPNHFLADNGTVAGRAKNRAATILATPIITIHGTAPRPGSGPGRM